MRARVKAADAGDRTRSVEQRLGELEGESRAAAQLTQDMAQQINALALAHQSTARLARIAIGVAAGAIVVAIASLILAWR